MKKFGIKCDVLRKLIIIFFYNYLLEYMNFTSGDTFPSFAEFIKMIQYLGNWKAAGVDGIFN